MAWINNKEILNFPKELGLKILRDIDSTLIAKLIDADTDISKIQEIVEDRPAVGKHSLITDKPCLMTQMHIWGMSSTQSGYEKDVNAYEIAIFNRQYNQAPNEVLAIEVYNANVSDYDRLAFVMSNMTDTYYELGNTESNDRTALYINSTNSLFTLRAIKDGTISSNFTKQLGYSMGSDITYQSPLYKNYKNFGQSSWGGTYNFTSSNDLFPSGSSWNGTRWHDGYIRYDSNTPVFISNSDADYYLKTGDDSKRIDGEGREPAGEEAEKYLYCITKNNNGPIKAGTEVTSEHDIKITYDKSVEGYGGSRPCAGYITEGVPYNIKLKVNPASNITKTQINLHEGAGWQEENFDDIDNPNWTFTELIQQAGTYYFGIINTNIPIFATEHEVNEYFAGRLSASSSLNGGGNYHGKPNGTGDKKTQSLFNEVYAPAVLSKCLICSFATLAEVAGILFKPDITSLKELTEAMAMFGENPISFISDAFMLPFNPRPFCQVAPNTTMSFGSYYEQLTNSFDEVITSNRILTMFNRFFDGAFNDWRDYMSQYFLYLPYVGITAIDIDKYLYKQVECKVTFDTRTGSIKYMLCADSVMVDIFEGNVRVSMPLCGSDSYTAAMNKVGTASQIIDTVVGAGSGNLLRDAVGDAENLIGSTATLTSANPKTATGNFSSSTAFTDQLDAYLIIAQQEYDYPDNLIPTYGLPDNDAGKIGNYSGYLECNSTLLTTNATETEINEILSLLAGGIII